MTGSCLDNDFPLLWRTWKLIWLWNSNLQHRLSFRKTNLWINLTHFLPKVCLEMMIVSFSPQIFTFSFLLKFISNPYFWLWALLPLNTIACNCSTTVQDFQNSSIEIDTVCMANNRRKRYLTHATPHHNAHSFTSAWNYPDQVFQSSKKSEKHFLFKLDLQWDAVMKFEKGSPFLELVLLRAQMAFRSNAYCYGYCPYA